jgi:predicted ester cyclase
VDEALNRGILDVIDETRGELAEHAKMKVRAWRTAFPDFHTTIETLVAEDDWIAYHVRHQGTHLGEFEGVAPTGKRVDFRTMVFNRFADGILVENWGLHDHASALAQIHAE